MFPLLGGVETLPLWTGHDLIRTAVTAYDVGSICPSTIVKRCLPV